MISTQLLKGVLDSVILIIISESETYGYDIIENLEELGLKIQEGTVYPILIRLEKKGYLKSKRKKSEIGPLRKYLSITEAGLEEIERFKLEWGQLSDLVEKIMEGSEANG